MQVSFLGSSWFLEQAYRSHSGALVNTAETIPYGVLHILSINTSKLLSQLSLLESNFTPLIKSALHLAVAIAAKHGIIPSLRVSQVEAENGVVCDMLHK